MINGLLDVELSVPNPTQLLKFWERRGMVRTDDGVLGTEDRDVQLRLSEGSYRHLSELHMSCETESDLVEIAGRIGAMGVESTITGTRPACTDPVFQHRVVIDVTTPHPLTPSQRRAWNHPGESTRIDERAEAAIEAAPRRPRRLGHIVLGTPRVDDATAFIIDGLGFRVSDQIVGGLATFARIEHDHHNLLIQPATTSHINHYAMEMDDLDAIGTAGQAVIAERSDASVVGVGRHLLGSNIFWYLTDPAGTMFELFSDMDQVVDDDAWARDSGRRDWGTPDSPAPISVWGPREPDTFFNPVDLDAIGAARETLGLD